MTNIQNLGVTLIDPDATYISSKDINDITFGEGCIVHPGVYLVGSIYIGEESIIGPNCTLMNVRIGQHTTILNSTISNSSIGAQCQIGPYALIEDSNLEDEVTIGFTAQIKRSTIGKQSVAKHHCYIGDTQMGERVNIGAGAITGNYGGMSKNKTIIGDGAFIGINVNLIAPVTIGRESYLGAGAIIKKNVLPHAVVVGLDRVLNHKKSYRMRKGWVLCDHQIR